ncbi:Serine endoprotease DegS, partial [Haemophilus influenzae]
TQAVP